MVAGTTGDEARDQAKTEANSARTSAQRDAFTSFGNAMSELHEQGKADRAAMRSAARSMGAELMDDARDFTEKMADTASKAAREVADVNEKVASAFSPNAGKAAAAAGDFAAKVTDAAGQAAVNGAEATKRAADAAAEVAQDLGERADAAAETAVDELLARAQAEAADWQDRFVRLHAEWDTYRRRTTEQRAEEKERATEGLVSNLLPVLDDFERSIEYAVTNGSEGLLEGVRQVHTKMVDVLTKSGVEVIDPIGQAFDALEAQAVGKVDKTDVPDETVDEVYQKGYKMGKKVIRPAMVTVTTGGPQREKESDSDPSEAGTDE